MCPCRCLEYRSRRCLDHFDAEHFGMTGGSDHLGMLPPSIGNDDFANREKTRLGVVHVQGHRKLGENAGRIIAG